MLDRIENIQAIYPENTHNPFVTEIVTIGYPQEALRQLRKEKFFQIEKTTPILKKMLSIIRFMC